MHSYLVIQSNSQPSISELGVILKPFFSQSEQDFAFDLDTNPDIIVLSPQETSIKISQVRTLQSKLTHPPIQSSFQLAVISQSEQLTTEAQHALLKTLEEPADHTKICLVATQSYSLLNTITSRCQLIYPKLTPRQQDDETAQDDYLQEINTITAAPLTARLVLVNPYHKDQESAQAWVTHLSKTVHSQLAQSPSALLTPAHLAQLGKNLLKAHQDLNSNVNHKLVIDQLVLTWDRA